MNAEFIQALEQIEKEKNISKEVLLEAIENSLLTACKNHFGTSANIEVTIDNVKGNVYVMAEKEVVEVVEHKELQISLVKAKEIDSNLEIGDTVKIEITPKDFGRIAAQKAKQVVVQKIREAERDLLFNSYQEKEKEVVTGIIQRNVKGSVIVNLGKIDAILADKEQVPGEEYPANERLKVYVIEVKPGTKGPKIYVSRTHPDLVKRLFENEVPEVHDGVVEIKSISREAGSRTKIAVASTKKEVDPVGSCVGHNGTRVGVVVNELRGEKIDIIPWSENVAEYIAASLSPSKVVQVAVDVNEKSAKVIVPDYQLSLAIGKEGQNARLAAKLTGYRIDIKSETQGKEVNFITDEDLKNPALVTLQAEKKVNMEDVLPFDESLFEE